MVRGGYRMIPWWCRRAVYRPIVAHYTERLEQPPAAVPPEAAGGPGPEPADGEARAGLGLPRGAGRQPLA